MGCRHAGCEVNGGCCKDGKGSVSEGSHAGIVRGCGGAALMGAACAEAGQDAMESKSRSRMSARSAMFGVRSLWARTSFVRGDVSCVASHVAIMLRS